MTPELAALSALFKPHMACVARDAHFSMQNTYSPDGTQLVQRNYAHGFEEFIVYSYDAAHRRYVRTQLVNDGSYTVLSSPGPNRGVWTFTTLATSDKERLTLRWKNENGTSTYWYEGTPYRGDCR